jgi:hypothetical protein
LSLRPSLLSWSWSFVAAIPPEQEAYLAEVHQKVEQRPSLLSWPSQFVAAIPPEQEAYLAEVHQNVEQRPSLLSWPSPFVAAIPPEQEAYLAEVHQKVERFLESEALSLELNKCNSYQRRLIYQTAKEKYPSLRHAQNISFLLVDIFIFSLARNM